MSLADVIKQKKNSARTTDRGPQFYNAEKAAFIVDMVGHEDAGVRLAACSNVHCPAMVLAAQLKNETEPEVIKAILMNGNLSKKNLLTFATKDPRRSMFDDDTELIDYVDSLNLEQ